jgi:hypothetical protein
VAKKRDNPSIGDLVVCRYDLDYFYYPNPGHPYTPVKSTIHMGIILRVVEDHYMFFHREFVFEVLCTDGTVRIFTEWEVEVVRKAQGP